MEEIKKHIDTIIQQTFINIQDAYRSDPNNQQVRKIRLIFPQNNKSHRRVSEQELRCIFIEEFLKYIEHHNLNWFYSLETPTLNKYKFKGQDYPKVGSLSDISANIDLTIHNASQDRLVLMEFKYNMATCTEFAKDFVKLANEPEEQCLRYFLHLKENSGCHTQEAIYNEEDICNLNPRAQTKISKLGYCYQILNQPENRQGHHTIHYRNVIISHKPIVYKIKDLDFIYKNNQWKINILNN